MNKVHTDFSECAKAELCYLGNVKYNTADVDDGVKIAELPKGIIVLDWICKVVTAFNAATTNVLVLGTKTDDDAYMAAGDITEGTAGWYRKGTTIAEEKSGKLEVYAKFTETGAAATAGEAEFYALAVRIPV